MVRNQELPHIAIEKGTANKGVPFYTVSWSRQSI
jgi:hypothetical protein